MALFTVSATVNLGDGGALAALLGGVVERFSGMERVISRVEAQNDMAALAEVHRLNAGAVGMREVRISVS